MQPKPTLVIISANAEWRAVRSILQPRRLLSSPFGEWFRHAAGSSPLVFFQGGWGKVSAAASAQYAILKFHPARLVNLGTCGGFSGKCQVGDILLVQETLIYDIYEAMGDAQAALDFYTTRLDTQNVPSILPLRRERMLSADRDIIPSEVPHLSEELGGIAADWESGAIAWVAQRNQVPCQILRGVSDVVQPEGDDAYGNLDLYHRGAYQVMERLLGLLPEIL